MEKAIDVKDLTKSFKDVVFLKGVNFQGNRGEIFTLLGSNGAGKKTIIKILSTFIKQDAGS